jgi:hypothetical protein
VRCGRPSVSRDESIFAAESAAACVCPVRAGRLAEGGDRCVECREEVSRSIVRVSSQRSISRLTGSFISANASEIPFELTRTLSLSDQFPRLVQRTKSAYRTTTVTMRTLTGWSISPPRCRGASSRSQRAPARSAGGSAQARPPRTSGKALDRQRRRSVKGRRRSARMGIVVIVLMG